MPSYGPTPCFRDQSVSQSQNLADYVSSQSGRLEGYIFAVSQSRTPQTD